MGEPEPPIKFVDRRRWAGGTDGAAGTDVPLRKPSYVEQLELQLAEKDAQLRDVVARYKEAAQEFDAARVRSRRDVVKEIDRGKRAILAELLDVLDNLDRAIDAASNSPNIATLLHGVEMVREQFLARLEGFGVTRIAALGERFDPACHEAATTVPTTDATQRDRVVGVIRQGYRMAGDVLRPAVVAVSQATQPDSEPESADPSART